MKTVVKILAKNGDVVKFKNPKNGEVQWREKTYLFKANQVFRETSILGDYRCVFFVEGNPEPITDIPAKGLTPEGVYLLTGPVISNAIAKGLKNQTESGFSKWIPYVVTAGGIALGFFMGRYL